MRRPTAGEPVKTVFAIVAWTLSLFGIEVGSQVRVDHIRSQGTDVLVSRVVARPTGTGFECVRSASGQCYYTVFADACAPVPARKGAHCDSKPVGHFALANGGRRQLATSSPMHVCVRTDAAVARPDCD